MQMLIELRKLVVIIESEWKADLPSAPGWLRPEGERVRENSKQLLALVTADDISSVLDHRSIFDYLGSAWLDCHSKAYKQTEIVSNCLNAELTANREMREIRDSDGRVFSRSEYLKGKLDGASRMWSADGTLTLKAHNQNGERHGPYQSWWDNGVLKEQGLYEAGKRVGMYRWYHESGELWKEHDYGRTFE